MYARIALVAGLTLSLAAVAADQSPAATFRGKMLNAMFLCELRVSERVQQERMYGIARSETQQAVTDCVLAAEDTMKVGYAAFVATNPAPKVKDSAKSLYSAALAHADRVSTASSREQIDHSDESARLRAADADFRIEAGL
jgi:hypothetical protein